jgi:5'(3')-deoxyribonucleotidase
MPKLVICSDKTLLRKGVLIDDNPKIITGFLKSELVRIVYDKPWNKHLDLPRLDWGSDYMKVIEKVLK